MYRGLWVCAMACANLKGVRCLFDLFLQKSSHIFSKNSPQDLTNANRSYSRVFVQGDESARSRYSLPTKMDGKRSLTDFLWKRLSSLSKPCPRPWNSWSKGFFDIARHPSPTARLSPLLWLQHQRSVSRRSSQKRQEECNQWARIINSHPRYLPLPGASPSAPLGLLV